MFKEIGSERKSSVLFCSLTTSDPREARAAAQESPEVGWLYRLDDLVLL